jgi:hypothetical protein
MAPVVLKNFNLPLDCNEFLQRYWIGTSFYERFLLEKLLDVGVEVPDWSVSNDNNAIKMREVRSFHPSKISFPGLPSHAEVMIHRVSCSIV